jgi:hypothetical protein
MFWVLKNAYKFWSENLKGRNHSEDLGLDMKLILEWIVTVKRCRLDASGSG